MSDLISRSELINKIRGIVPGSQDVDFIVRLIENQPTTYNIDKVVEELEEQKHMIALDGDDADLYKEAINDVIEIVKQGDVSDDVCEWKKDDMCETVYMVCGGCFTSEYQKDFKYCPYCGKKIKVVE